MQRLLLHSGFCAFLAPVLLLLTLTAGCEPGEDEDARREATIEALQERAQSRIPAAEANFGYIHHLHPSLEHSRGKPLSLQNPGLELELDEIALVISAMELHRCSVTNTLGGAILDWLIPSAHAHVPSSATRFGTPWVEDLLAPPGFARMVGGIAPPLGVYCELHVILAPADDDVINITNLEPHEIEDNTLLIRGRHRTDSNDPWTAFEWTDSRRQAIPLRLVDPHSGESPVHLHEPERQLLFLLDKTLSAKLFADLSLREENPDFTPFFDALIETFSIYQY